MREFGARLTLKDNMSNALRRAVRTQREFSRQVQQTNERMRALGRQRANPQANLRDRATPAVNRLKNSLKATGRIIAKPFVMLKDKAGPVIKKIGTGLKAVGKVVAKPVVALVDRASRALSSIGNKLKSLAKGVTIGIAVSGAAAVGKSLQEGAALQQSIGGIKTLFGANDTDSVKEYADLVGKSVSEVQSQYDKLKESENLMIKNANRAWQTAGLSANGYMEQSTSFAASLLQSLDGDTMKAANAADKAVIDMADNANKFGSNIQDIQNAYQGFAKQNYTMLDNLKLGYGGTQQEMKRLLEDAQKISGQEYDMSNLADVYEAIHVVQDKLHITGTTAREAASTFSGSFASMKAAASNLMAQMSIGDDKAVIESLKALTESASTFLFGNFIPMVGNIISNLPDVIGAAAEAAAPMINEKILPMLGKLKDGIMNGLKSLGIHTEFIDEIIKALTPEGVSLDFGSLFGGIKDSIVNTINLVLPIIADFVGKIKSIMPQMIPAFESMGNKISEIAGKVSPIVSELFGALIDQLPNVAGLVESALGAITTVIESLIPVIEKLIETLSPVLDAAFGELQTWLPVLGNLVSTVITALTPLIDGICNLIQKAMPVITQIAQTLASVVEACVPVIGQIIDSVVSAVTPLLEALEPVIEAVGEVVEMVAPIIVEMVSMVGEAVQTAMPVVSAIFSAAANVISAAIKVIMAIIKALLKVIRPIFEAIKTALSALHDAFSTVFNAIKGVVKDVGDTITNIVQALKDTLSGIFGGIQGALETLGGVFDSIFGGIANAVESAYNTIVNVVGKIKAAVEDAVSSAKKVESGGIKNGRYTSTIGYNAWGKNRIPYDNYPTILHQGERVLTRVEADHYDKTEDARSLRGMGSVSDGLQQASPVTAVTATPVNVMASPVNVTQPAVNFSPVINIHDPVVREDIDIDRIATRIAHELETTYTDMAF